MPTDIYPAALGLSIIFSHRNLYLTYSAAIQVIYDIIPFMIIASSAALTSNPPPPLLPRASLGITFIWYSYSAMPYSECERGRSHKIKDVKRKPTFSAAFKGLFCFFSSPFFFFFAFRDRQHDPGFVSCIRPERRP